MSYIILDRDGVINYDSAHYIKSPDEWIPIPGSLEAVARLNKAGYHVLIVTNQSGLARGYYDLETLENIHQKFYKLLADVGGNIEEIFFCPHHPDENCLCRKPKPALFHQIQKKYNINFSDTFYVGDSACDIQVAQSVGCKAILVLTGNGEKTLAENPQLTGFLTYKNLAAAVDSILGK